jgi:hypothetical protein
MAVGTAARGETLTLRRVDRCWTSISTCSSEHTNAAVIGCDDVTAVR